MTGLAKHKETSARGTGVSPEAISATDEVVALCPGCKAFETLWFAEHALVPTRKFFQRGSRVFHDCGSREPCRLLMRFMK